MQVAPRLRRVMVGLSVAVLAVSGSAFLDNPHARAAASGAPTLEQLLADPLGAGASDPQDPGVVGELPENLSFHLSPELAAALGISTLDSAGAAALLARRGAAADSPFGHFFQLNVGR